MLGPFISVVIPVKNRSSLLLDCLRALAGQSLAKTEFEVLVVDNCSSEDLGPVFDAARQWGLALRDARTTEDRGPGPARNLGARMARGTILAFTDSDCRPSVDWLKSGRDRFEASEVSIVSGPVLPKPEQTPRFTSKLTFVTRVEHPTFPCANLMICRDAFLAAEGFDETLSFRDPLNRATECADTDLVWRLIESGHGRSFVPDMVVCHEIEHLSLLLWLLEPTRLFVLPELVRRHPGLRGILLSARLVFYPRALLAYPLLVIFGVVWSLQPVGLAVFPVLLLLRAALKARSLRPGPLLAFGMRAPLHMLKWTVYNLTMLFGSIRFRCLVL